MNINFRAIIPVVIALIVAGAAALLARSWLHSGQPASTTVGRQQPANEVEVAVAKENFPAGYILQPKDVRWQAWPDKSLAADYVVKSKGGSIESFQNAVVRVGVASGEPITWGRVIKQGDRGYLAAILTPGMRAFSIRVSEITGISGLLFPGDRVDLVVSHKITKKSAKGEDHVNQVSETVLDNARVIAIDQKTNDQDGKPQVAKTVTLELTPKQVEIVSLAANLGEISLSLHSLADTPQEMAQIAQKGAPADLTPEVPEKGKSYTWDSQVSHAIPFGNGSKGEIQVGHGNVTEVVEIR
jgi:pilus assembly protein CpaB